jgi:hypothetical protein
MTRICASRRNTPGDNSTDHVLVRDHIRRLGLFAPRNLMTVTAIFLCSLGIGSAIRMATELQTPFHGLIRISSASLEQAVQVIGLSQPQ